MITPTHTDHTRKLSSKVGSKMIPGFTLIELTMAITVGLMIATMSITLFSSQLTSYQIIKAQNFLVEESPQISNTLNSIISRANFFQMYTTLDDATTGENSVIIDGKVLALKFEDPGDTSNSSYGVIHFDATDKILNYYHVENMAELAVATPSWKISSQVSDADFFVQNGVLRITLTGPNAEAITYSATTQR